MHLAIWNIKFFSLCNFTFLASNNPLICPSKVFCFYLHRFFDSAASDAPSLFLPPLSKRQLHESSHFPVAPSPSRPTTVGSSSSSGDSFNSSLGEKKTQLQNVPIHMCIIYICTFVHAFIHTLSINLFGT